MDYSPRVVRAGESARAAFIRRTYGHLAAAVLAFAGLIALLFEVGFADAFMEALFKTPMLIFVLLFGYIAVSWLADVWARSEVSLGLQYFGLAVYVVVEAFIFLPILWYAQNRINDPNIIPTAGILTLAIFAGLTMIVFTTRKDFSFLGPILCMAFWVVLGLIVASWIFGFTLGLVFSFAMVALASAAILYDTSNIIHHYRTNQHVAAALALFASVALLFFYILRILIAVADRD
jgi:FtsH-binding integral membrane protein